MQQKKIAGLASFGAALFGMTGRLAAGMAAKCAGLWHSFRLTRRKNRVRLDSARLLPGTSNIDLCGELPANAWPLSDSDASLLCAEIRQITAAANTNNITRTEAYMVIFADHPELHWALLAHLVSRNGGWHMTDLAGEWLPEVLERTQIEHIFTMLEACNSFIFGDAYPQLLLYAESKRRQIPLFLLLPEFGVSAFMRPFWERFWRDKNPVPLTYALIVNEQHFIQKRVVENEYFLRRVLESPAFVSQPFLQMNQIVFPLLRNGVGSAPLRLAGRVMENFADLEERVAFGQSLYTMLLAYPAIREGAEAFARNVPHTGSRADYWPRRFAAGRMTKNGGMPKESGNAAVISSGWFSPPLTAAWPDRPVCSGAGEDWFVRPEDVRPFLTPVRAPLVVDITHEHLFAQRKLQTAALLARSFRKGDNNRRTGRG